MTLHVCVLSLTVVVFGRGILACPVYIVFCVLLHVFWFCFSTLRTVKPYLKGNFRHMHKRENETGERKKMHKIVMLLRHDLEGLKPVVCIESQNKDRN